jgi:hypothetical protein
VGLDAVGCFPSEIAHLADKESRANDWLFDAVHDNGCFLGRGKLHFTELANTGRNQTA